jgi:protein phosphatase
MGGTATAGGVTLGWAAATDVGNDRAVNEDAVLAAPPVFLVADGMGGHQAGDVASSLVVDRFGTLADGELRPVQDVVGLLDDVNRSIFEEGQRTLARSGMGTTAVGLLLVDNGDRSSWLLFNIGDSRAYRWADGELEQLSVDHSYVQELIDAGEINEVSARAHPHRNVVTRALGVEDELQPDLWLRPPRPGERYLLCSDGLSSEIDDLEIGRILARGSLQDAADALIGSALAAGGHDNVTVLVLDVLDVDAGVAAETTAPREELLALANALRESRELDRARDEPDEVAPDEDTVDPVFAGSSVDTLVEQPAVAATEDDEADTLLIDRVPEQSELELDRDQADDRDDAGLAPTTADDATSGVAPEAAAEDLDEEQEPST